jgi:argininosuccinate lyase
MAQWSSFEVGHLYVPNSLVQISSIMPQKRNPVPIEHMRLISSKGMGFCDTLVNAMHNTPFTDMNDSESESQQVGYQAFDTSHRLFSLLNAFISSVSINGEKVQEHIDQSCATITELADTLVRKENISFRQAHHVVAELATFVVQKKLSLQTVSIDVFTQIFEKNIGRSTQLNEQEFRLYVSAKNFIEVRSGLGGPAPVAMKKAIFKYKAELENSKKDWRIIQNFTANAATNRAKSVLNLTSKKI